MFIKNRISKFSYLLDKSDLLLFKDNIKSFIVCLTCKR